jgi:expansin (peptidoglycan-binding protein)
MGSVVFALPAALLGITVAFGVVAAAIASAFLKDTGKKSPNTQDVTDETEQLS